MLIECTVVIPALMVIVFSGHRQPRLNKGTSSSFMSGGGSWKLRHTGTGLGSHHSWSADFELPDISYVRWLCKRMG